jgi:hypothetical protein
VQKPDFQLKKIELNSHNTLVSTYEMDFFILNQWLNLHEFIGFQYSLV